MGTYAQNACKYFKEGYNCAQSVLLAFAPLINFDNETALKLASSFGGGMGRLREVCGAVTSMFMIAGILKGYSSNMDDVVKAKHYELIQFLGNKFKEQSGSLICREILGIESTDSSPIPSIRTAQYYKERPCENCIKIAAEIIEKELLD